MEDINQTPKTLKLVIAEDEAGDRKLIERAFKETSSPFQLDFVYDGEELIQYLNNIAQSADYPNLILLDLNMPKKGGLEALQEIKSNPKLSHIPVIIYTTSDSQTDILKTYNLNAHFFITKPQSYDEIKKLADNINNLWLEIMNLPARDTPFN